MKYIIFLALICASFFSHAQTIDSTWTVNVGGVFFSDHLIQYSDGSSTLTRTRLGDTTQVLNTTVEKLRDQSRSMARDIEWTSGFSIRIKELIRQDASMSTLLNRSAIKEIVAKHRPIQIDSTYKIKPLGGVAKTIKFSMTAAGVLRYKIDTFTIRQVSLLGDLMRLNNYQNSGNALDLYLFTDGRWRDATRSIQIYQQADGPGAQNRAAPEDSAPIQMPLTVYTNGLVYSSGKYWKWNIRKKTWETATLGKNQPIKL